MRLAARNEEIERANSYYLQFIQTLSEEVVQLKMMR